MNVCFDVRLTHKHSNFQDEKRTRCSFYEILFALRLLVEELEEALYPIKALSRVPNRYYRWLILLLACQSNPKVQQLLDLMKKRDIDVPDFAEQLQLFYPDDANALRSVRFPTSCFKDQTKVENVLEKEGKELTQKERKTISILINARYPKENQNSSEKYVSDKGSLALNKNRCDTSIFKGWDK